MHLTRRLLRIAGAPLLGGCMWMGGAGHGPVGWVDEPDDGDHAPAPAVQRAEASSEGITIALSFPAPSPGATVTIRARVLGDDGESDPVDRDIQLQIQTPDGSVDELPMRRGPPTGESFQAQYRFSSAGVYLVTAEARARTGADVRTVSVMARTVAEPRTAHGTRQDWVVPALVLGGIGWIAMMAVMMAH